MKHSRDVLRRLGASLLAMVLSLSLAAPALTQTAYAFSGSGSGTLTIDLYDAETGGRLSQGLARMEARKIVAYDVTDFYRVVDKCKIDRDGNHILDKDGRHTYGHADLSFIDGDGRELLHTWNGAGISLQNDEPRPYFGSGGDLFPYAIAPDEQPVRRWTTACLNAHATKTELRLDSVHTQQGVSLVAENQLVPGHKYVILEERDPLVSAYCYEPNVYNNDWNSFYGADGDDGCLDWDGSNKTLQLYNNVMRGGFTFSVRDVETNKNDGSLQTMGFPETSVFAVFNISDTAVSPDSYEDMKNVNVRGTRPSAKANTVSGVQYGQAMVKWMDRYGAYHYGPMTRAYSYDEVMRAYDSYLSDSNKEVYQEGELGIVSYLGDSDPGLNYYNGMYGYGKYKPESKLQSGVMSSGIFDMNGVRPVAMLMADKTGRVSTGNIALPAGNYLVLQVKSPSGYYIDENFRLAVAVGPWYYNHDIDNTTDPDRWGDQGVGFGNALFDELSYTLRDSGLLAQETGKFKRLENYPAVFVGCGTTLDGKHVAAPDLSDRYETSDFNFGVDTNAGASNTTPTEPEKQICYNISDGVLCGMGNGGNYLVNAGSVGERRNPHAGYSRVTAYVAPVRAGVRLPLADTDGILRLKTGGDGQNYAFEGQGDAKLEGSLFRLYHDRAVGHDQNGAFVENELGGAATGSRYGANTGYMSSLGLYKTNGSKELRNDKDLTWENGSTSYKEYTALKQGKGEYVLNIPVDELPFGEYTLVQAGSSEGYGDASNPKWAAHIYEELAVAQIRVVGEDKVYIRYGGKGLNELHTDPALIQAAMDKYTVGSTTYLPQTVYRDDASIAVSTRTGIDDGVSAEISVYNISDRSILLNDAELATAKPYYDAGISGQTVNMASLRKTLSTDAWDRAKIWFGTVAAGAIQTEGLEGLPFGSYLIAVTGATGDYSPVGGAAAVLQIRPGQAASVSIILGDKAAIPDVSTKLADGANRTKSVSMIKSGMLIDQVSLGNLQSKVNYVLYGLLVDKATGEILPGSHVQGLKISARGGGTAGGDLATEAYLANLRDVGRLFSEQAGDDNYSDVFDSEDYFTWLMEVSRYAGTLRVDGKSDAAGYITFIRTAVENMIRPNGGDTFRTKESNAKLTAQLNGLVRYFGGAGDMSDTSDFELKYENLDMLRYEGRTIVAYAFVCEGAAPDQNVLNAKTLGAARAAMDTALVAEHASVANLEQTVYAPSMDITATGKTGNGHKMAPTDAVKAVVAYKNLEPETEYKITGHLKDADGVTLADAKGKPMTVEKTFTTTGTSGSVEILFEDLKSGLEGSRLTVYVDLSRIVTANNASQAYLIFSKGDAESMGWNAKDKTPGKNQVDVVKATVHTTLTDMNGNKTADLKAGSVKLRDRVEYTGLIPGERYASVLTLMYPNGDPVLDKSGREVTATAQFTARNAEETVNVDAAFDGRNLKDKTIIAFNDLRQGGSDGPVVISEHDLEAESQTMKDVPSPGRYYFQTSVKDDVTGNHYTQLGSAVAITDTVTVQGLEPNESFTLKTEIADAKSGSVLGQIPAVTSKAQSGETGVVNFDAKLAINTTGMSGRAIVVYQSLYSEDGTELIIAHTDQNDSAQTLYVPGIDTVATGLDGVSKSVTPEQIEHVEVNVVSNPDGTIRTDKKVTYTYEADIRDRIDYVNLSPCNTYTVETAVQAAAGGAALARQTTKLSPADHDGSIDIDLKVDVTKAMGKDVVVTETIIDDYSGKIILQHNDLKDPDQTVKILIPGEIEDEAVPGDGSQTGEDGADRGDGSGTGSGTDIGDGQVPLGGDIQTGVAEHYTLYLCLAGLFLLVAIAGAGYAVSMRRRMGR